VLDIEQAIVRDLTPCARGSPRQKTGRGRK
jgi:hypothetical protein